MERRERANLTRFARGVENRHGLKLRYDYRALHQWSVDEAGKFWTEIVEELRIHYGGSLAPVNVPIPEPPGLRWFPNISLNYAENLLRWPARWVALIEADEQGIGRHWSFAELRARVAQHQQALRTAGIRPGDCVAGILCNTAESVAAMLAAASIGATWCSVSPDFGAPAALDRLGQVQPSVLYAVGRYRYGGKVFDVGATIAEVVRGLPGLRRVVQLGEGWPVACVGPLGLPLEQFLAGTRAEEPSFLAVPFNQPLFVLFTSGTTGAPKCIVHSHGGTLLQLVKEHQLHCDLRPQDRIVFPSTLGWMMWNWLVTALASGATVVLYDGSPATPRESRLFALADELKVAILGLPGAFLERCRQRELRFRDRYRFEALRMLFAGGSVVSPETFRYVYDAVAPHVHLASGSGGTDIISCFMLGNPWDPVWAGELQAPALGMDVKIFDEQWRAVVGQKGELVCINRTPSMPVRFANDPGSQRYHKSYFERFPGVWAHGDYAEETAHGGFIIYGRSDAVLNPGGVRIGTAEIYRQVLTLPEIVDCVAVGQAVGSDVRIVLFVTLTPGATLDEALRGRIREVLRSNASPRHVPRVILQVPDIPRTRSNKISESAVAAIVNGQDIPQLHALANPQALEHFRARPELAA